MGKLSRRCGDCRKCDYGTSNPGGCWDEVAWAQIISVPWRRPWYCGFWPDSCR